MSPAASRFRSTFFLSAALALISVLLLHACSPNAVDVTENVVRLRGRTMGTTYSIIVLPPPLHVKDSAAIARSVDSLLVVINEEVNTYDSTSMISRLNTGLSIELPVVDSLDQLQTESGAHFAANLSRAKQPYLTSGGAFDPTVGPLVEYYGFGAGVPDTSAVDANEIERLRLLIGFDKIILDTVNTRISVSVASPGVMLDLSAVAKGYAVDQIAELLAQQFGARDYFVEIGGETRTFGHSPRSTPWTLGINRPDEIAGTADLEVILEVGDAAVATSGNYRNVRRRGGQQVVHTIDPKTGLTRASSLLSATVVADNCATADAYATACMASGEEAGEVLAKAGLSGCLIFAKPDGGYQTVYVGDFATLVVADHTN